MKNIIFILVILVLSSFILIKRDKVSISIDKGIIPYHLEFLFSDSDKLVAFECEEFVSDALIDYTIDIFNKDLKKINCSKESVGNRHDSDVIDTIYTFSNRGNIIQFYKSNQNDFLFTFDVTDSIFTLIGSIKPGMTKDVFFQNFQLPKMIYKEVQIINPERNMSFTFYFQNNRLQRIISNLYLD